MLGAADKASSETCTMSQALVYVLPPAWLGRPYDAGYIAVLVYHPAALWACLLFSLSTLSHIATVYPQKGWQSMPVDQKTRNSQTMVTDTSPRLEI